MPKLEILTNSLLMQGESGKVLVTLDGITVTNAKVSCSNDIGMIKKDNFLAKDAGVCTLTAIHEGLEAKTNITIMARQEEIGKKTSKVKDVLIDTSMFAVLNPDMFILVLIILGCIVCTTVITLIFVKEVTFVKTMTGLITLVVTFLLSVAKTIMPKGKISKELEVKYFPKGESILKNTAEFLLKKGK